MMPYRTFSVFRAQIEQKVVCEKRKVDDKKIRRIAVLMRMMIQE